MVQYGRDFQIIYPGMNGKKGFLSDIEWRSQYNLCPYILRYILYNNCAWTTSSHYMAEYTCIMFYQWSTEGPCIKCHCVTCSLFKEHPSSQDHPSSWNAKQKSITMQQSNQAM